jgi:hypothetical protein
MEFQLVDGISMTWVKKKYRWLIKYKHLQEKSCKKFNWEKKLCLKINELDKLSVNSITYKMTNRLHACRAEHSKKTGKLSLSV